MQFLIRMIFIAKIDEILNEISHKNLPIAKIDEIFGAVSQKSPEIENFKS